MKWNHTESKIQDESDWIYIKEYSGREAGKGGLNLDHCCYYTVSSRECGRYIGSCISQGRNAENVKNRLPPYYWAWGAQGWVSIKPWEGHRIGRGCNFILSDQLLEMESVLMYNKDSSVGLLSLGIFLQIQDSLEKEPGGEFFQMMRDLWPSVAFGS